MDLALHSKQLIETFQQVMYGCVVREENRKV
jgi:hypothetical protein